MPTASQQHEFPDRVRLPLTFDAARMTDDLERLTASVEWTDHFVRQNYDGDWSAIPLRAPAGATHSITMIYSDPSATVFVDTRFLADTPYIAEVIGAFRCPLQAVRLMRLAPDSYIKEHQDLDLAVEFGVARLHVPVTTNPDVEFWLNGTKVSMSPGSAWYLRLSDPHSVANRGNTDRVHLVIDALVNDWLVAELNRATWSRMDGGAA